MNHLFYYFFINVDLKFKFIREFSSSYWLYCSKNVEGVKIFFLNLILNFSHIYFNNVYEFLTKI